MPQWRDAAKILQADLHQPHTIHARNTHLDVVQYLPSRLEWYPNNSLVQPPCNVQ
jgi:carbonic anhydrase